MPKLKKPILLSILIPAFNYPSGISKILNKISTKHFENVEIIIFDDSNTNDVSQVVQIFVKSSIAKIRYQRNNPALGAVKNWNSLLDSAQGEFCLLMHHDEYPLYEDFIQELLAILSNQKSTDVIVLNCLLTNYKDNITRQHAPNWLRRFIIKYTPHYLFRRNVIGPISSIVFRRSNILRFDENLQWFVDVNFYIMLRRLTKKWIFYPDLKIVSTIGRDDSITNTLLPNLKKIIITEYRYLSKNSQINPIWLGNKKYSIIQILDNVVFYSYKMLSKTYVFIADHTKFPFTKK